MKLTIVTALAFSAVATISSAHDLDDICSDPSQTPIGHKECDWGQSYIDNHMDIHERIDAAANSAAVQAAQTAVSTPAPTPSVSTQASLGAEVAEISVAQPVSENRILNTSGAYLNVRCTTSDGWGNGLNTVNVTLQHGQQVSCFSPRNSYYTPATVITTPHNAVFQMPVQIADLAMTAVFVAKPNGLERKVISGTQATNPGGVPIGIR